MTPFWSAEYGLSARTRPDDHRMRIAGRERDVIWNGTSSGTARFDRVRWGRMPRKDASQCYCCGSQVQPVSTTGLAILSGPRSGTVTDQRRLVLRFYAQLVSWP